MYKTMILHVVLYGCETLVCYVQGRNRLRVFVNRVLRRMFGAKKDEVIGG
jgi:hypothetical protein